MNEWNAFYQVPSLSFTFQTPFCMIAFYNDCFWVVYVIFFTVAVQMA